MSNHGADSSMGRVACGLIAAVLITAGGCNFFKPLALILPEPKRKVPAEFAHLSDSAAVVVWAQPETLYNYPNCRLEVASHVTEQLQSHLPKIRYVDPYGVEDYLQKNNSRVDPENVGRHFGADYVIYLELLEFGIRDPRIPDLLQGRVHSSVTVYEIPKEDLPPDRFELSSVQAQFPPGQPVPFSRSNALNIRKITYQVFAGEVAKKFYEHEETVE